MKRIVVLITVGIALGLPSCKKAYTCECTSSDSFNTVVTTREISKTGKKTAEAICGDYTTVYTPVNSGSGSTTLTESTNCALK
jgi:hypothetical protein